MVKEYKSTTWNKTKSDKDTSWNKTKKSKPTDTSWNKKPKTKITKTKSTAGAYTVWDKPKKKKFTNANKKAVDFKKIVVNIESWDFPVATEKFEEKLNKYEPRDSKKDYKLVAHHSRWLDIDWDSYRFCEVTFELTWEKINADEIHHIFSRRGGNYNNPEWLIFVSREQHEKIHKYDVEWLKSIVQKYLVN